MRKDFADSFAAEGLGAAAVLDNLKPRGIDALALALAEAQEGSTAESDNLATYRFAKEQILPLLLHLEDEGERDAALRDIASKLKLTLKPLRKALCGLEEREQEKTEQEEPTRKDELAPQPGTERYERAMDLLRERRLLARAAVDMKRLGHVGEFVTKQLAFVCALSARSGRLIQPSTHAQSSAGKNYLWDTVLSLLPPEKIVKRSGLSAKALFRTQVDLRGAVLYIQEVAGSEDADFTIRVLQSDGRLEYEATEKGPDGSLTNRVYQTEGPTVVVQTTTKNHLHAENETRVFPLYIDESEGQTSRIVKAILKGAAGGSPSSQERKRIQEKWHDAIRLLEPAEVDIPYAERISMPTSQVRIRRDAPRLMDMIRVIAWLYQYQRERDSQGRIVATEQDFHIALGLVSESLTRAWQTLTPAEEKILGVVKALPEKLHKHGFQRRDLKIRGVSDRRVKEVLKSLTETGYLDCDGRKGPQGYSYTLAKDTEKITLDISLRPPPDGQEIPANRDNSTGRKPSARYRPVPGNPDEDNGYREAGATRRNGHRPIESDDLQEKYPTGRAGSEIREDHEPPSDDLHPGCANEGRQERQEDGEISWEIPLSFDLRPGESATLRELRERRERQQEDDVSDLRDMFEAEQWEGE
jgi:hypothetical protein